MNNLIPRQEASERIAALEAEVEALRYDAGTSASVARTVLDENAALKAQREKLLACLKWYVENDETYEGDEPLSDKGGASWNEINEFWIEGKRMAIAAIADVEGGV